MQGPRLSFFPSNTQNIRNLYSSFFSFISTMTRLLLNFTGVRVCAEGGGRHWVSMSYPRPIDIRAQFGYLSEAKEIRVGVKFWNVSKFESGRVYELLVVIALDIRRCGRLLLRSTLQRWRVTRRLKYFPLHVSCVERTLAVKFRKKWNFEERLRIQGKLGICE